MEEKTVQLVSLKQVVMRDVEYDYSLSNPKAAADLLIREIGSADREHFAVITLNTKNQINGLHIAHIGALNAVVVTAREIFKFAVVTNASAIIVGHNHPSGDTKPSADDIRTTERLIESGELLGVKVLDHIIVSTTSYYSLGENGRLQSL